MVTEQKADTHGNASTSMMLTTANGRDGFSIFQWSLSFIPTGNGDKFGLNMGSQERHWLWLEWGSSTAERGMVLECNELGHSVLFTVFSLSHSPTGTLGLVEIRARCLSRLFLSPRIENHSY
jgi:hypothetical protein